MRMLIFFDLPTITSKNMVDYRKFRKFLLENGFIMMQESIYSKLVINNNSANLLKNKIKDNLPPEGIVELLQVTEKQFANIDYLVGKPQSLVIDSDERLVEI